MTGRVITGLAVVISVLLLTSGCGGGATETTGPSGGIPAPPADRVAFGHISSLRRHDVGWVLRFDPASFLSGETANVAAGEDGVVTPGEPVPNDNYVVDESGRIYTYLVADDAEVVVLTRSGDQIGGTEIDVTELERILAGTSTLALFEPIDTGVWLSYRIDTVSRIVQQYQP